MKQVADNTLIAFLSGYDEWVFTSAMKLREIVLSNLPGIIEQTDIPAKMVAYSYGQNMQK